MSLPSARYRYLRQIRLPEVGAVGQDRLCHAEVAPTCRGFAAEIESRYLRFAGVNVSAIAPPEGAAPSGAATAMLVDAAGVLDVLGVRDAAARDVAEGAVVALTTMRRLLRVESP